MNCLSAFRAGTPGFECKCWVRCAALLIAATTCLCNAFYSDERLKGETKNDHGN